MVSWPVPIEPTPPDDHDLPSPRQITAHVRASLQLAEDLEQPLVHGVVERVVLVDVVVGDGGDRAIDVEPHTGSGGLDIGGNVGRNERTFKGEEAVCPT